MRGEEKADNVMDEAESRNEEALKGDGCLANENDSQKWGGGVCRKLNYDNSVDCCYAMPDYYALLSSITASTGERERGSSTSR